MIKEDPRNQNTYIPENRPDIELMHVPSKCISVVPPGKGVFTFLVTLIRPKSTGTVRLASTDPAIPPSIDLGYFTSTEDYIPLRAGVRLALRICDDVRKQGYQLGNLIVPDTDTDDGIDEFIRSNLMSGLHFTSTCRMGKETHGTLASVVDVELKVHGVSGLRVCDTSIFPEIIGSHTMAPAVMVAEKCADMIRAERVGSE